MEIVNKYLHLSSQKHPQYTLTVVAADMKGEGLMGIAKVILTITDSSSPVSTTQQALKNGHRTLWLSLKALCSTDWLGYSWHYSSWERNWTLSFTAGSGNFSTPPLHLYICFIENIFLMCPCHCDELKVSCNKEQSWACRVNTQFSASEILN